MRSSRREQVSWGAAPRRPAPLLADGTLTRFPHSPPPVSPPPERLLKPITDYIEAKGGRIHLRSGCK
jgi:hypothetical protein